MLLVVTDLFGNDREFINGLILHPDPDSDIRLVEESSRFVGLPVSMATSVQVISYAAQGRYSSNYIVLSVV